MARILVVDDQPELAELMQTVLEGDGHTVEAVHGGQAALERTETTLSGAIVIDERGDRRLAFKLRSPAFGPSGEIPLEYTSDGADVSPPVRWTDPPEGTKSFALMVDDGDAGTGDTCRDLRMMLGRGTAWQHPP